MFMPQLFINFVPIFAQTDGDAQKSREYVVYELARLSEFDDERWLWSGVIGFLILTLIYVIGFYRRESSQIASPFRFVLPCLRLMAIVGAVLFFLKFEKRTDEEVVTNSEVVVMVDSSQSMSVEDEAEEASSKQTRIETVKRALNETKLIKDLLENHNVTVGLFDSRYQSLQSWERLQLPEQEEAFEESYSTTWVEQIQPVGTETRLGDAMNAVLNKKTSSPLAGVLVFSDGGFNGGIEPTEIAELAGKREVPIITVGLGSTDPRRNLSVQEINVPSRIYPEDKTNISALIQAEGFEGRNVNVELFARLADEGTNAELVGQQQIAFSDESQSVPIQFEIEPAEVGRLVLEVKVNAPAEDQYPADNRREAEVEVVEAKTRVLLIASGATRDYRFLRNQLRRDAHATVDIWLQSSLPGISQDADEILEAFPSTKEELYPYDCIVAFDPDWGMLDALQVDLLEKWVAEEAGGLVVIAGPVHTSMWIQSPEHVKIRALYPVEFQKRLTLLDDGIYGSQVPWPIEFSRDGEESNFLWLAENSTENQDAWAQFDGVYGCYAVKGPKPGARVLGRYSDPEAGISTERPVYMAEQFYGSGRVFYMGSGEVWRLRTLDVGYFEILYTNLIRHVSQGRLLRGSSRGQLLVQRDRYSIGDEVVVRAKLYSESREPLVAQQVTAHVVGPDNKSQNLKLLVDENRPGNFLGQFSVRSAGSYRIELPMADSMEEQLVKRIQVVVPDREFERTRRNETLLVGIATNSGGVYYPSIETLLSGNANLLPIETLIPSLAESKILRGTPDEGFIENLNRWLLGLICGTLCLEWFLRRLLRLA